ncbi:PREDICTED: uncharacterized protein LOC109478877 [Branchiostoma belcheri]|uniref:Uncharacterized protein LOC109478877 n=1 Tax=Branchiostoma belcheri TaxID=7741 RepID=A0A6P4ZQD0_BRABE|nr:PREDICTED: uncharacterized protein LOC109478877 [Branchiostoma belcheri]
MFTRKQEKVRWHERYDEDAVKAAEDELETQHEEKLERERVSRQREREERDRRERHGRERREQEEVTRRMALLRSDLTNGLKNYRVGSKTNIARQGIDHVNIAMFGPAGGGKTSFIQIAETILLGRSTVITQSDAKEGTIILLESLTDLKFHLFDTGGFFDLNKSMHQELNNILTGRIRPSQIIAREEDRGSLPAGQPMREGPVPLTERMHGVICILGHKDPKEYSVKMQAIRKGLKEEGYSPVGAVAFESERDYINGKERERQMVKMSAAMGSPRDRTFAFVNHIATGTHISAESAIKVMDTLDTALIAAEGYIKVQQQRETYAKERAKSTDPEHVSIREFMVQIAAEHYWSESKVDETIRKLEDEEIYNVAGLKQFWDEVKPTMSLGMRSVFQSVLFPK